MAAFLSLSPVLADTSVIDLVRAHGGTLLSSLIKGIVLWGGLGLVAVVALYVLGTRRGWVDIRGQRKRVARVVYGLVLFLGVLPLLTGAGLVHELGKGTVEVVRAEMRETRSVQLVGNVLIAPVALAHLAAQGQYDETWAASQSWQRITSQDMSFLLQESSRRAALDALTTELMRSAIEQIPGYQEARDREVLGWLLEQAERKVADKMHDQVGSYARLFDSVAKDEHGRVTYDDASNEVGIMFWRRTVEPLIRSPFNTMRWQLALGALLLLLLTIGLIQGIGRHVVAAGDERASDPDADDSSET